MKEYVVRNKNIFMICILIVIVITIFFYVSTTYAIVDGTVYTRDELSELIQNQDSSISELDSLINSNYNAYNIYVNNEKVDSLITTTNYYLDSYTCQIGNTTYTESNNVLNWNMGKQQLTQTNTLKEQMTCDLYFYSDSYYTTTLAQKIYNDNQKIASRTNFSTIFTENTTGKIYYTSTNTENVCDNGDTLTYVSGSGANSVCKTYFFAGNTNNTHVKFGNYLWNIIRINEDESVRLLFDKDINNPDNIFTIYGGLSYNYNDAQWVGYMNKRNYYSLASSSYADANTNTYDSEIKKHLDIWYSRNIQDLNEYVSQTAIYCNDRTIFSGVGYGSTATHYGAFNRLITNKNPQYKCPTSNTSLGVPANNNLFTKNTTSSNGVANYGNGKLKYPIGLITADELYMAGLVFCMTDCNNTGIYISTSRASFYTMTPSLYQTNGIVGSKVFSGGGKGYLFYDTSSVGTGPSKAVLSLKSCVKYVKGNGTENSPYEVIIDSACASAIN